MGVEFEAQTAMEHQQVKTRELQKKSVEKLNEVTDMVDNLSLDSIETDTKMIKEMVYNNLENQVDNDDLSAKIDKISQGIADIKRSQTNLNKKINEIEDKIGE